MMVSTKMILSQPGISAPAQLSLPGADIPG